ncbi:hypothetical protein PVE_P0020 (plasmid) [Pseudomonas veronii 1YdBTEX2]|jgi:hypothetical protein|uniref:Uncharacterized protein n=2 Tax=Pseudomonas veronii TaxID=76761 RepID=A0A7Y1FCJ8_PSEVE|nr:MULTISPECIES: hypothetical protein [Pseudomonas]SBW85065.1 hypothetical protein PVE_P0020 [Pseudomonas veronii 1YdBTEX2]KAA0944611.1 hypothetical protein FQ186_29295 [Pseudomonas sp. ANT_H14]KAA0946367.1 hypothetical protein FQ182_14530 [Pseudomonas sp. ANT_H4]MBI6552639.1 hypothetical protein [Pseudomonas veronii]MBI6652734.1 hypothetical protein [Pseudomonas veronii]
MNSHAGTVVSKDATGVNASREQLHVVFTPDHEEEGSGLKVDISEWLSEAGLPDLTLLWTHTAVFNIDHIGRILEWYYVEKNPDLKKLVQHCQRIDREVMPFGYQCTFNAEVLKAWILANRLDLGNSLVCLRNSVIVYTTDTPGFKSKGSYFWYKLNCGTRSSERFDSELDAGNNAVAVLNLA